MKKQDFGAFKLQVLFYWQNLNTLVVRDWQKFSKGDVKVFRKTFKNEVARYYIMYLPDKEATKQLTRVEFKEFHTIHWGIECYHFFSSYP